MQRRAARWTVAATVAFAAACGGEAPAPVVTPAAAATAAAEPRPRVDVAALSQAEVDALVDVWRNADKDARRAAEDRLLAAGALAAERLLALVDASEDDDGPDFWRLFPRFGADAVHPLVARLSSQDARVRSRAMTWLERMAPDWAYGADGAIVCRALLARLAVPDDRDGAAEVLKASRPAGRAVAEDVAKFWRAEGAGAEILVALGPDAAPAAPIAWDELTAATSDQRCVDALRILAATRVADASRLDLLIKLLDSPASDVRAGAVQVIENLGDAAAPASARLVALLGDADENVRGTARRTLRAIEPKDDALWIALLVHDEYRDLADRLAKTPDGAALLVRLLPVVPADALESVVCALHANPHVSPDDLAALMTRHPLSEGRALAPRLWLRDDDRPPPKEALVLLADADPKVRAAALAGFAPTGVVPDAKVLADATALATSSDPDARAKALEALGSVAAREPKAVEVLLAAMADADRMVRAQAIWALRSRAVDDPAVRKALAGALDDAEWVVRGAALEGLATIRLSDEGIRRAAIAKLVESLLRDSGSSGWEQKIDQLAKFDGGLDALAAAIRPLIATGEHANFWARRDALRIAGELASRMPSIRDDLVHLLETGETSERSDVEGAISHADFAAASDPDAIARGKWEDFQKVEKLRALGQAGLHALVLVAAATSRPDELRKRLADLDLRAEVAAAAAADGADAAERRKGAAVLAPLLPDADAVATLTKLAPDEYARPEIVDSLEIVAKRTPGSVPASLVVRLLRRADGTRYWGAFPLIPFAGRAVAELDPAIVDELVKLRDDADWSSATHAHAAAMLFHLTGRADEALPTFRALLARPERLGDPLPWHEIGDALGRMTLSAEDVAAFVPTLQRAASCCDPPEMDQDNGPGAGDDVLGALTTIVPALEHCGPQAAPAVPALSLIVSKWPADGGPGAAAVRALGAIGPAARPALPDLRRAMTMCEDPSPVREAIRRIESKPK